MSKIILAIVFISTLQICLAQNNGNNTKPPTDPNGKTPVNTNGINNPNINNGNNNNPNGQRNVNDPYQTNDGWGNNSSSNNNSGKQPAGNSNTNNNNSWGNNNSGKQPASNSNNSNNNWGNDNSGKQPTSNSNNTNNNNSWGNDNSGKQPANNSNNANNNSWNNNNNNNNGWGTTSSNNVYDERTSGDNNNSKGTNNNSQQKRTPSANSNRNNPNGFHPNETSGFALEPRNGLRRRQRYSNSCWAAAGAMAYSYKNNRSVDEEQLVNMIGEPYRGYYNQNIGLAWQDHEDFARAIGMTPENISIDINPAFVRRRLESSRAPILTVYSAALSEPVFHAIIIVGIFGDGSIGGTTLQVIDPADGEAKEISFEQYYSQYFIGANADDNTGRARTRIMHY